MIDIAKVRADTPACAGVVHFNNAGSSLTPDPVHDAVVAHLELERRIGGYEAAARAEPALDAFYTEMAALLGARPDEIAWAENATRAWDMAFYGLPLAEGDRVLTHGGAEYASNFLAMMQLARRRGIAIDVIPSDGAGQLDLDAMTRLIGPRTRAVAITHVPTQGGLVNPAEEVGRIAADHGLIYLLDACQSAGQIDLDVGRIGCHLMSGTGRKFLRGPRGSGFLYVRRDMIERIEPPFIDLRAATWTGPDSYDLAPGARRFENWESYVAGRIGLAEAVRYARVLGLPAIEARVTALAEQLRGELGEIPGVEVRDLGHRRSGIVTFTKDGECPKMVQSRLAAKAINVSTSTRFSAQIDFAARNLDEVVRASVHYYNTETEIARFVRVLSGG